MSHPEREIPHIELRLRDLPQLGVDKVNAVLYRRHSPGETPWITRDAIEILEGLIRPTDVGVEFGAGGSTIWFARRCARVSSVDGFPHWHDPLKAGIEKLGITNVRLELASADELGYETDAHRAAYVGAFPDIEPESLDFVFVDGEYRDECTRRGLALLKPGGLFILDNANSFLPSKARSRWKVSGPASPGWAEIQETIQGWRTIWTTNGVWDTAMWWKP